MSGPRPAHQYSSQLNLTSGWRYRRQHSTSRVEDAGYTKAKKYSQATGGSRIRDIQPFHSPFPSPVIMVQTLQVHLYILVSGGDTFGRSILAVRLVSDLRIDQHYPHQSSLRIDSISDDVRMLRTELHHISTPFILLALVTCMTDRSDSFIHHQQPIVQWHDMRPVQASSVVRYTRDGLKGRITIPDAM